VSTPPIRDDGGYTLACRLDEVPPTGALRVVFGDLPVAIVRSAGEVYAIHDVCSHASVALSEGEVEGTTIECWLHGSRFDLRTGDPIGLPATRPVPVYPVAVDDGHVFVRLPAPAPTAGRTAHSKEQPA
jgi:3-phenylpropionate/trans-cinnamate dioxygenase ferredoxin subunit